MNLHYKDKPTRIYNSVDPSENYRNEVAFLVNNSFRHEIIKKTCSNFENNILIMVNTIAHGEALLLMLQESLKTKQFFFIQGAVEVEDRDKVKQIMESNDNIVCIAISSIFSTGVNIKNIHAIIFAEGGASSVRIIQSIGRGLRLNDNKELLVIIDIADMLQYGYDHSQKRKLIYEEEKISYSEHEIKEK
jgi:superfamily II DNA or RNA helicase